MIVSMTPERLRNNGTKHARGLIPPISSSKYYKSGYGRGLEMYWREARLQWPKPSMSELGYLEEVRERRRSERLAAINGLNSGGKNGYNSDLKNGYNSDPKPQPCFPGCATCTPYLRDWERRHGIAGGAV